MSDRLDESGDDERKRGEEQRDAQRTGTRIEYRERDVTLDRIGLMTIGTFLGAVWANESWGRYWGWDPKETWALITMVIYAIVTHLRLIPKCNNLWLFNFTSILAFYSVLMTFFGVNYFLSGMHSYGQNDNVNGIFIYLYLSIILVLGLAYILIGRERILII